jgi:hypothetical protein
MMRVSRRWAARMKGKTMDELIRVYRFLRLQQQLRPVDALADAAAYCGIDAADAAAVVRTAVPADSAALSLM